MAMKLENPVETLVGAVVLAIAIGFAVYASQQTGGSVASGSYPVIAKFSNATGVSPGTDVRVAGVKVGSVVSTTLDETTFEAAVTMAVNSDLQLAEDTIAKIDAEGLLGGSYVALEPGIEDAMLKPGDEILFTQGAISLTGLISRVISGGGGDAD